MCPIEGEFANNWARMLTIRHCISCRSLCRCSEHLFQRSLENCDTEFAGRTCFLVSFRIKKIIDRQPALFVRKVVSSRVQVIDVTGFADVVVTDRLVDRIKVGIGLVPRHMNGDGLEPKRPVFFGQLTKLRYLAVADTTRNSAEMNKYRLAVGPASVARSLQAVFFIGRIQNWSVTGNKIDIRECPVPASRPDE